MALVVISRQGEFGKVARETLGVLSATTAGEKTYTEEFLISSGSRWNQRNSVFLALPHVK